MMFNVADGGISEPIDWDISNLKPNNSIIVMDEENLRVWLWHGKARMLVPKRTALRQAQSLKGHGYQAGNAIIGRGITSIFEIDDRKVGHYPETTKWNEEFLTMIKRGYKHIGDHVFVLADGTDASVPLPASKPAEVKKPVEEKKKIPEVKNLPSGQSTIEIAVSCPPTETGEYKELNQKYTALELELKETKAKLENSEDQLKQNETKLNSSADEIKELKQQLIESDEKLKQAEVAKSTIADTSNNIVKDEESLNDIKKAITIFAVMEHYKDIWASKKSDGSISMEQLDGKICSFKLDESKIDFLEGSFAGVAEDIKSKIQEKINKLISQL